VARNEEGLYFAVRRIERAHGKRNTINEREELHKTVVDFQIKILQCLIASSNKAELYSSSWMR